MKRLLILLLLMNGVYAQISPIKHSWQSVDIIYGQKFLSHNTFNGHLNDLEQLNAGQPISYIGIGITGAVLVSRGDLDNTGNWYYTQIIPQKVQVNDSIRAFITGFNVGITLLGVNLLPNMRHAGLLLNVGANMGRLRLYGNSYVTQKNPYLAPKLQLTPRIQIGRINLQCVFSYEVDVSRKNWRRMYYSDSPKINMPKTSSTGLTVLFSVGYVLKPKPNLKPEEDWPEQD